MSGGHGIQGLSPHETAVLVLGMQNDYCHELGVYGRTGHDLTGVQMAASATDQLLVASRAAGCATVFIRSEHGSGDSAVRQSLRRMQIHPPHAVANTWGAEFFLAPTTDDIILTKHRYSAFADTRLEQTLRDRGITSVVVVGIQTHVAVLATAIAACDLDFRVVVPEDAVASYSTGMSDWAMLTIGSSFGTVVTNEILTEHWKSLTHSA